MSRYGSYEHDHDGDSSSGSVSLGFPDMDRSEFLARRANGGGAGRNIPHHYSGRLKSVDHDESTSGNAQPSLQKRAMRRPSLGGLSRGGSIGDLSDDDMVAPAHHAVAPRARRRMPRRPSLDAIKTALDNDEDITNVVRQQRSKGRMPRRPSMGSVDAAMSAGAYDGLSSGDEITVPTKGCEPGGAGGGRRSRPGGRREDAMQRQPSMVSMGGSLAAAGDGSCEHHHPEQQRRRASTTTRMRSRPSTGSLGSLGALSALGDVDDEPALDYSEQRKRVPRRASMDMNMRPSCRGLDAGPEMCASPDGDGDGDSAGGRGNENRSSSLAVSASAAGATSDGAAAATTAAGSLNEMAAAPQQQQAAAARAESPPPTPEKPQRRPQSSTSPPAAAADGGNGVDDARSSPRERRRASMDRVMSTSSASYRDMLKHRPSISCIDAEKSEERTAWTGPVKEETRRSSIQLEAGDVYVDAAAASEGDPDQSDQQHQRQQQQQHVDDDEEMEEGKEEDGEEEEGEPLQKREEEDAQVESFQKNLSEIWDPPGKEGETAGVEKSSSTPTSGNIRTPDLEDESRESAPTRSSRSSASRASSRSASVHSPPEVQRQTAANDALASAMAFSQSKLRSAREEDDDIGSDHPCDPVLRGLLPQGYDDGLTGGPAAVEGEANTKAGVAKAAETHFVGWGQSDAGTITDDGTGTDLGGDGAGGAGANDGKGEEEGGAEVYEGFGNRDDIRERSGSKDVDKIDIEEEFDSRRPWRKAPANHRPEAKEAASDSASMMSFNMDGTNANVAARDRQVEPRRLSVKDVDNLEGIGARRMSEDSIGLESRSCDASVRSLVKSEDLSEFAYAQAVLERNKDDSDDRPTRSGELRRAQDPYTGVYAKDSHPADAAETASRRSEESLGVQDPNDAAAIIAAMYREDKANKRSHVDGNQAERRRSSLHLSDDSLLEGIANLEDEQALSSRKKNEPSAEAAADRSDPYQAALTQESAPSKSQGPGHSRGRDSYGSSSDPRKASEQDRDENLGERTFQYWNDYGDLDRDRRENSRDPLLSAQADLGLVGSNAAARVLANKKQKVDGMDPPLYDESLEEKEEKRDKFGVGANLERNGNTMSRKDSRLKILEVSQSVLVGLDDDSSATVPTGNKKAKKSWRNYQGSSDRSGEVAALMDNFPADQKPRGRFERFVGPKVWRHRRYIFIGLLVVFVAVVAIAIGLSVGKKDAGGDIELTTVPSESKPPSPTDSAGTQEPTALPNDSPNPSPNSEPGLEYQSVQTIEGTNSFDYAGSSVSFSSSGQYMYLAVGFRQGKDGSGTKGLARVYGLLNAKWTQVGGDILGLAEGDEFGSSVSLSDDGQRVAVGAHSNDDKGTSSGHVRVFEFSTNSWVQIGGTIEGAEAQDRAGFSVALSGDGKRVAVGAPRGGAETGSARVFEYNGANWVQMGQEIFGEETAVLAGYAVSLSKDGLILAMSAPRSNSNDLPKSGRVAIYQYVRSESTSVWEQMGQDITGKATGDQNGESVSLSSNGLLVAIGANGRDAGRYRNAGYCRVYSYDGQRWVQDGKSLYGAMQGEQVGYSVSLSKDGSRVACAGPNSPVNGDRSGIVRVYDKSGGDWSQIGESMTSAAGSAFGFSVSLANDGSFLAVGAPESDLGGLERAGLADIYTSLL